MKKQTLSGFALTVLFLVFGAGTTPAQSLEKLMTIQVPFDFQVDSKVLPAGEYVIKRDPQMPQHLQIQSPKRKISVIVFTSPLTLTKTMAKPSLAFKEYGEKRFLAEVRDSKYGYGYALIRSKAERELARAEKPAKARRVLEANQNNN